MTMIVFFILEINNIISLKSEKIENFIFCDISQFRSPMRWAKNFRKNLKKKISVIFDHVNMRGEVCYTEINKIIILT